MNGERKHDLGCPIIRVGLDLGANATVFQTSRKLADLLVPRTHRMPTVVSASGGGGLGARVVLIGEAAAERRDEMRLRDPLSADGADVRGDFAGALRAAIDPEGGAELWGVVNCPQDATAEETKAVRSIAYAVFQRTKLVDDAVLMATSFGSHEVARWSIWIDVGMSSIRASAVQGGTPGSGESFIVPGGVRAVIHRLRDAMNKRYPDFRLTEWTLRRIIERFAHVSPSPRSSRLDVRLGQSRRVIDLAPLISKACDPLVDEALASLRGVLSSCPSDSVEEFLDNIILAGGGARIHGFFERLLETSRSEFGTLARVRIPDDPTSLVANGALRWAHFLSDDEWEIPLFSRVA